MTDWRIVPDEVAFPANVGWSSDAQVCGCVGSRGQTRSMIAAIHTAARHRAKQPQGILGLKSAGWYYKTEAISATAQKTDGLKPKDYVTMTYKWSEVRRHNDSINVTYSRPTINPEIEVVAPSGFKTVRNFGSVSGEIEQVISRRERVFGT